MIAPSSRAAVAVLLLAPRVLSLQYYFFRWQIWDNPCQSKTDSPAKSVGWAEAGECISLGDALTARGVSIEGMFAEKPEGPLEAPTRYHKKLESALASLIACLG